MSKLVLYGHFEFITDPSGPPCYHLDISERLCWGVIQELVSLLVLLAIFARVILPLAGHCLGFVAVA